MASLLTRLWNSSPGSIGRAITRRVNLIRADERWHEVAAGPVRGAKLLLPTPLSISSKEMVSGTFDQFIYVGIANHRSLAGASCWDLGANIGYHTLGFALQGAELVAFEPNTTCAQRLRLHVDKNPVVTPRVQVMELAVADQDGELGFVESDDLKGASSGNHLTSATLPLGSGAYAHFEQSKVSASTMDTLVENRGGGAPDIIEIVVEGAEYLVLEGGRCLLGELRPLLLIEVHHITVMLSLTRLLTELGYQLSFLDENHSTPSRCFVLAA